MASQEMSIRIRTTATTNQQTNPAVTNPTAQQAKEAQFPFLKLPVELRLKVYEYYLKNLNWNPIVHHRVEATRSCANFLRVSKQIHDEVQPMASKIIEATTSLDQAFF
jgi:hypothetical protein